MSAKQELAKLEPVEVFHEHQALTEEPAAVLTREKCRELRDTDRGYFISSGRQFRLFSRQKLSISEPEWEELLRRYGIRDEGARPTEDTVFDYAQGKRRAVAIVEAWERNHRGLKMLSMVEA